MSSNKARLRHTSAFLLTIALFLLGAGPAQGSGAGTHLSSGAIGCAGRPATIIGTPGGDSIDGTAGKDVIVGLDGDDVIHGLEGVDLVCGGPGNDLIKGGPGTDGLNGGSGDDSLRCGPGFDDGALSGGSGNDTLYGKSLCSNALHPGLGDDLIVGGSLKEWTAVFYEDATGPIHANLMTGIATGQGTDTLVNVNSLFGGPYDDTLIGDSSDNWLVGREGDDTLIGQDGNEILSGEQDDDAYRGGAGFDIAEYFEDAASNGRVIGPMNVNLRTGIATGDGTDTLDSIEGATGSDRSDTMIGDRKGNSFYGLLGGDDTVHAGGGNDGIRPGSGANVVSGGAGEDFVDFYAGKDEDHPHRAMTVDLGAGTTSDGDTLMGVEDVIGSIHSDRLIGDAGPNWLFGILGNDVLEGRAGDDRLIGDDGADEADGGTGNDRCSAEVRHRCERARRGRYGPVGRDVLHVPIRLWGHEKGPSET